MACIYLDNAATTRVTEEIREAIDRALDENWGNPSSLHEPGYRSAEAIAEAREEIACFLGVCPNDLYFTSCGTESDNWALVSTMEAHEERGRHLVVSSIEHPAVLNTCAYLEKRGFEVTYLPVDSYGLVSPDLFESALRPDTVMASVMFANNEVGTIEPIETLSGIAHAHGVLFHTDAVQAFGHVSIACPAMGIDLLSASGHKLHAPKGIGLLYAAPCVGNTCFMHGGQQERGRRGGTENTVGIAALAAAVRRASDSPVSTATRITNLRNRLVEELVDGEPHATLNGHPRLRLPGNANLSFSGIDGIAMVELLASKGICASSGSACSSREQRPSHVLSALTDDLDRIHGAVRFSLGDETTEAEIETTIREVRHAANILGQMGLVAF